jgi:hypothetical protein
VQLIKFCIKYNRYSKEDKVEIVDDKNVAVT